MIRNFTLIFIFSFIVSGLFAQCSFTVDAGPDISVCYGATANLTGSVNPSAGAYTYQWTPAALLSNATTLTPSGVQLADTTFYLSVTSGGCTAVDSMRLHISGVSVPVTATATPSIICPGQLVQLDSRVDQASCGITSACVGSTQSATVGGGNTTQPNSALLLPTLFGNTLKSVRNQMLYTAFELNSVLPGPCTIKVLTFNMSIFNSNAYLQNFTISMGCTNQASLSVFDNALTPVVTIANYPPHAGTNSIVLSNAFNWDGISNLVIDICWYDPTTFGNQSNKATCTNTAFNSYLYIGSNTLGSLCGTSNAPTISTLRPNVAFQYCIPDINTYAINWTPASGAGAVTNATIKNPTANPVVTTAYTVNVSNAGCNSSKTVTVQVDTSKVSAGPDVTTCPASLTALHATAIGPVIPGPATYTWTTLAGAQVGTGPTVNVAPVANTTYVVAMGGGPCIKRDTIVVNITGLNVSAVATNVTCNGAHNGTITASSSNGAPNFSYNWSANANTGSVNTASNLGPGNYSVIMNDANGCSGSASATITEPTALSFGAPTVTNVICHGDSTGSIVTALTGGTPPYTYLWSNSLPATQSVSAIPAGNYTVTATDFNLCNISATIPVTQPTAITFGNAAIQQVRCLNGNTGSITISVSGGAGGYTYTWSHNAQLNSTTASGLIAGQYSVIATDIAGCHASATYSVVQPSAGISFNAPVVNDAKCFGSSDGNATANPTGGTPPYTYVWTPTGQTTQTAINLSARTYTVLVTDDSVCTASTTITVGQPAAIQITLVSITNEPCNGDNTGGVDISTANGAQPLGYNWTGGSTNQDLTGVVAGTYVVTVTDQNSCVKKDTFTITQPTALTLNAPTIVNVLCNGGNSGSITANPTGGTPGYSYAWTPGGTTQTIGSLTAGPYTVVVTDAHSCNISGTYQVTEPATPLIFGAPAITDVKCNGLSTGAITVSVTGGTQPIANWNWSHDGNLHSPTASALAAGPYTVTATDLNGCTIAATNTVQQPSAITFGAPIITNIGCNGGNDGSAEVTPTGGTGSYTYRWNGTTGPNPRTGLTAGNYNVLVTDSFSCTASTTVVISEPAALGTSTTASNALCSGASNGSITVNVTGGNQPYTYLWNDPRAQTTQTATQLTIGTYTVTVTDNTGCNITVADVISEPAPLFFIPQATQVACAGDKNGTVFLSLVTGGTPPYTYSVTPDGSNFYFPSANDIIEGLASETYTVIVSDLNGCTKQDVIFVPAPVADTFSISALPTSCFGSDYKDGTIQIMGFTPQNMPYQYSVDSGLFQLPGDFYYMSAGTHTAIGMNNYGCKTGLSVVVPSPLPASASVMPGDTILQLGQSIQLATTFGPYGDTAIVSYLWVPSLGLSCTDCPNPLVTPYAHQHEYTVNITYNDHCTVSAGMNIIVENHLPVFVPNSFSPNGDGNNDVFQVYGQGIKAVDLKIFNRWGEIMYQSTNQYSGWDGTYKGESQTTGVYTYTVQITYLDDKQIQKSGSVTLIR